MFGGLNSMDNVAADISEQIKAGGDVAANLVKQVGDVVQAVKGGKPVKAGPVTIQTQPTTPTWVTPVTIGVVALGAFVLYKAMTRR